MEKILIVDDEPLLACIYEDRIKERYPDALVAKASNGKEAMAKVSETEYSLILSDLVMPVMDGIDFYKALKSEYPHMTRRVGFISGSNDETHFSFLADEGRPVLPKPFKSEVFYQFIHENLRLAKNNYDPSTFNGLRQTSRLRYIDGCLLEPVADAMPCVALRGITEDYSEGGLRLMHEGDVLAVGTLIKVFVNALGVVNREARVVWSSTFDSSLKTGLQWV